MKKKIVIVGPAFPYRGGNSLFISHLYDLLKDSDDVVIYNYKLLYPSFLFPGTTQYDTSETVIKEAPSVRAINSINPFNWFSAAQQIKNENPDLVMFDWWHPFFAPCHFTISWLLKMACDARIMFIAENFISHEGSLIDYRLTKIGLSQSDSFLTLSDKVASDIMISFPGKQVYKAELPIYDCYTSDSPVYDKKNFGFAEHHKVLLFFGYIRHYKGLDILIRALKDVLQTDPDFRLLAVGESYENVEIYTNLIKELHLEEYIHFENNFTPNEEVWKYYSASDVVVLPYRSATQSGILNIAYGFLKPVISTRVGGLHEFIDDGKTGLLVAPDSVEDLARGIIQFTTFSKEVDYVAHIQERLKKNLFYAIPDMLNRYLGRRITQTIEID